MNTNEQYMEDCTLCPRGCHSNRLHGQLGYCKAGALPRLALASIHQWEEPPISGTRGSGAIFFSGCNMGCIFCQNYTISQENHGQEVSIRRLAEIMVSQQEKGVHNVNLVSAGHFLPQVRDAIKLARDMGLSIPIVYNSNGYETVESLRLLDGCIDIYLPDLKYFDETYAVSFSHAPNYFSIASAAILEMLRQVGAPLLNKDGIMQKGIIVRHLILPGCKEDSKKILRWIKDNLDDNAYVSLLNQYTPLYQASQCKQLSRRLTTFEYQKVTAYFEEIGLNNGFVQKRSAYGIQYTPNFDLSGLF